MQALRARFVERARAEADQIEQHASGKNWGEVRSIAHGIAGRAGMFGFSALSDEARILDNAIDEGEPCERLTELSTALTSSLRLLARC